MSKKLFFMCGALLSASVAQAMDKKPLPRWIDDAPPAVTIISNPNPEALDLSSEETFVARKQGKKYMADYETALRNNVSGKREMEELYWKGKFENKKTIVLPTDMTSYVFESFCLLLPETLEDLDLRGNKLTSGDGLSNALALLGLMHKNLKKIAFDAALLEENPIVNKVKNQNLKDFIAKKGWTLVTDGDIAAEGEAGAAVE